MTVEEMLSDPREHSVTLAIRVHSEHVGGQRTLVDGSLGTVHLTGGHEGANIRPSGDGYGELLASTQHKVVVRNTVAIRHTHSLIGPVKRKQHGEVFLLNDI